MKRLIPVVIVLAVVAAAAYLWYTGRLSGIGKAETVGTSDAPGAIVGSGTIEAEELAITSELGGRIVAIHADEGEEVDAGMLLVELDTADLLAQRSQLEAAVSTARANLAETNAGPREEEIAAAEAELNKAIVSAEVAKEVWQEAKKLVANPQEIEINLEDMKSELAIAEKEVEMARASLQEAQILRDEALRNQSGNAAIVAQQVAQKQVEAAEVGVETAEAYRDGVKAQIVWLQKMLDYPVELVVNESRAEAAYNLAMASIEVAQANLAAVSAAPRQEDVKIAGAKLQEAEAALAKVDVYLDQLSLEAPRDGIVTERSAEVGELAAPGAVLMTVGDLEEVKLTVFIPETQIGRVQEGQSAKVYVDAYPGEVFEGVVTYISPEAEFTPKNVQTKEERVNLVFAVKICLDNPDHRLKPGMPADAEIIRGM